jgi:hypothetical protein
MEDEWVLKIFSPQELRTAVDLAYPDRVEARLYSFVRWEKLPNPIWVLILRRLWRQSRTNMLVCKSWCEIVHTEPEYWRLAYWEKLQPFPSNFPTHATEHFATRFHTFDDEFFPTFFAKVGWLFPERSTITDMCRIHDRFTNDLKTSELKFVFRTNNTPRSSVYYRLFQNKTTGNYGLTQYYVENGLNDKTPLRFKLCYSSRRKGCIYGQQNTQTSAFFEQIRWVDKDADLHWEGTGWARNADDPNPIPDGDGVWSRFSTGEVLLTGKGVAHRGVMDDEGVTYHRGKRVKTE